VSGATVDRRRDFRREEDSGVDIDTENDGSHNNQTNDCNFTISSDEWDTLGISPDFDNNHTIPTMKEVADRIADEKGIHLYRIQYVVYRIICSSFMLGVLNEGWDIRESTISESAGVDNVDIERGVKEKIADKLREIGGKDQLLMFITGPAGAGKSTSLEVAQHFCFSFCRCIGYHWNDSTFLFTAMTGCAASLFGGITLHSAPFLSYNMRNIICCTEPSHLLQVFEFKINFEISFFGAVC
jgi:hypothetical protein